MVDPFVSEHRRRFAIFAERVYMASQCLGPILNETWRDFDEYRASLLRRNQSLRPWLGWIDEVTGLIEQVLHAPKYSVALHDNVASCQSALAAALSPTPERNRVLMTDLDFHSSRYLWRAQAQRGFVPVEFASRDGGYPLEELVRSIDERVAVVAVSLASPRTGALLDVAPVAEACKRAGALFVLDAYQAVGVLPLDVQTLGADVLLGGNHKWLSGALGMGLAFMYVRPGLAESLPVVYPSWFGDAELTEFREQFIPAPGARRFQQGTPALEPIYTSRAGLRFILEVSAEAMRRRSLTLTEHLIEGALARNIEVVTPRPAAQRGAMVCLQVPRASYDLADQFAARGVDIDFRPGAGLRIGPHPCQTEEECDRVLDTLVELLRR
jgi:selenocysteine lyase/cysteine desulfurase